MASPADNAATVRRAAAMWATLAVRHGAGSPPEREADQHFHRALDALLAQAEAADRTIGTYTERVVPITVYADGQRLGETIMAVPVGEAAEERAEKAEAERDAAVLAAEEAEQIVAMIKATEDSELKRARRAAEQAREALRRVRENARSWHGPETDTGHARALSVIAEWCDAALTGEGTTTQRHGRDCRCTPCRAEDWDAIDAGLRP